MQNVNVLHADEAEAEAKKMTVEKVTWNGIDVGSNCIYRKTGEGNVLGRPLLAAPLHYLSTDKKPGKWVIAGVLLRKTWERN